MSKKPLIYLASPYTHKDPKIQLMREGEVCFEAARLIEEGHLIYCPIAETISIANYGMLASTSWSFWREKDLGMLSRCDELWICALAGWQLSTGIKGEVKYAWRHKIPIRMYNLNNHKAQLLVDEKFIKHAFNIKSIFELND